jgi:predicted TIM-barrel fold metal-dependent hydrolase
VLRRDFCRTLSLPALGALSLLPSGQLRAQNTAPLRWIDMHHHYVSPKWTALLASKSLVPAPFKGWTPEGAIEAMDRAGVAMAVSWAATYIAGPGVEFGDDERVRPFARDLNEYGARLVADYPRRFGFFAVLPMPDIGATLAELAYASDTLKAGGVCLATSYGDRWLGDVAFGPVFEELNRRAAIVYCHPTPAPCCRADIAGVGDTVLEYGFNTTRAIVSVIEEGTAAKYPNVRFVFSHAGGTLPLALSRFVTRDMAVGTDGTVDIAANGSFRPSGRERLLALRRFYYDTAQQANPIAMTALRRAVPVSQILFGTDAPFEATIDHVRGVQTSGVFDAAELRAVAGGNAVNLLGGYVA